MLRTDFWSSIFYLEKYLMFKMKHKATYRGLLSLLHTLVVRDVCVYMYILNKV